MIQKKKLGTNAIVEKMVLIILFFFAHKQILENNEIVGCVTVEPYMLGDFVKLTNNTGKKDGRFQATDYGLAFGHFTYLLSGGQEVVVDLQGVSLSLVLENTDWQRNDIKSHRCFFF